MARYDQGGGCACGLVRYCDCGSGQADGRSAAQARLAHSGAAARRANEDSRLAMTQSRMRAYTDYFVDAPEEPR